MRLYLIALSGTSFTGKPIYKSSTQWCESPAQAMARGLEAAVNMGFKYNGVKDVTNMKGWYRV